MKAKERIKEIEGKYRFGNMVAKSGAMKSVFNLAQKAAQYRTTVLITGESGTGKELVARGIHFAGERSGMPFIPVNCGGIPEALLESEFFGYKKGAFTGADRNKKGLFEEADRGTILLDEIGEMPLQLQIKFLRVLQENEVRPVGDSRTKKIDVRVIAATAKNLEREDIPLLCQHFIRKFKKTMYKDVKGIAPDAMSALLKHRWPGNVRELENAIERAVVLAEEPILRKDTFPQMGASEEDAEGILDGYSLKVAQKLLEKKMITKALIATRGNRSKATQLLEISHPSLLSKIKTYNIS